MDILDEVVGQGGTVDLNELIDSPQSPVVYPLSSLRNRAATTALLSDDPSKAVENYQLMMQESEEGQDTTYQTLKNTVLEKTQKTDMKGVMSVLSDPSLSLEQKQAVIGNIKQSQFLKDSLTNLQSNAFAQESEGESPEEENSRLSSLDAIREIYDTRQAIQGLVNAHGASLPSADLGTVGDMAALWVLPFGNNVSVGKIKKNIPGKKQTTWDVIKGFLAPGSGITDIRKMLEDVPPEQRVDFARSLIDTIQNNSGIVFSNDNHFAQYEKASQIFDEGGYSSFEEFVDNVSPLLDILGIGQTVRGLGRGAKAIPKGVEAAASAADSRTVPVGKPGVPVLLGGSGRPTEPVKKPVAALFKPADAQDTVKRIELNSVVRKDNPASPAAVIQQSNPQKARLLHAAVSKSQSDETAEGLYGVNKEQAIANDIYPQVDSGSGAVTAKVNDIQRNLREEMQVPDELIDMVNNTGAIYYTNKEKAFARGNVVRDFHNAEGMTINDAMSSFNLDGGRININAVYGLDEGGFLYPNEAIDQALSSLRAYGVLPSEVTLMHRKGQDIVPVTLDEVAGREGQYFVRVETSHDIDPTDITKYDTFDVKRNFFDRVPFLVWNQRGSVTRNIFDASSTLHPVYTGAATVVSDTTAKFDKFMLGLAADYSDQFTRFDNIRKAKIDEYIREANYNGVKFDRGDLTARGFTPDEISALRSWRDFWDAHFYLENYDVVRTLNAQGYQLFKNQNTELYARPIAKNQNIGKIYDPASDSVIVHSKADGDALYNSGGTYARLRRPTNFNGVTAEYMLVRNTPNEYLRKFRDSDQVLNYRDGYFQIQYKAPKFVDEIDGDSIRAVAVAGDTAEAQRFADRMRRQTGLEYRVRSDERSFARGDDGWWDVNSASGRIAQRHRGKLLEDGSGLNHLGDGSYILNPVDSATRAARSISGRTVSRPMLEAAKARAIYQYADVFPSNGMGGKRWPNTVGEIGSKGEHVSGRVADARTTYEYINYLENGYINSIDEAFKQTMNAVADILGRTGLSRTERAAIAVGEMAPTSVFKNGVFNAYIGTNIFRQWIVQTHQVVRTYAYNPTGYLTGRIPKLLGNYVGELMGSFKNAEGAAFKKFMDDSGLFAAVDKQNLVRGTLTEAADSTNRVVRVAGKALNLPRKIGFDIGEQANLMGHAAAVYDRYRSLGRDLNDKAVRDAAYSEIRAISYDMNFAGDMPYNQTSPAMILQFMQVPHKAFLQATNRRIPTDARLKLLAGDILMWGTPAALIGSIIGADVLPDNPDLREWFLWGAEGMLLNKMFSELSGEQTDIDFSTLAPYDMTGWARFFEAMYSGGFSELITNSPAGQLFFKEGGRAENAIAAMGRYWGAVEDDDEDPETFISVMNEVLKMSSGWNNAVKAKILLDARQRYDQYGDVIDQEVNHVEAWAQALGFGTSDTRDLYRISMQFSKDNKAHKEEVLKVYQDIRRYYAEKLGTESTDPKYITKVTGRIMKVFENDPVALGIVYTQLRQDLRGKDQQLLYQMMKRSGIPEAGNIRDQIKQAPISEDQKKLMLDRLDDIQRARTQGN